MKLLGDVIPIYFTEAAQSCPHDPAVLHTDVQSWKQKAPSTWLLSITATGAKPCDLVLIAGIVVDPDLIFICVKTTTTCTPMKTLE